MEKAPTVLDAVGDVLPDRGVFGIVKNLVDGQPGLTSSPRISPEMTTIWNGIGNF